MPAAASLRKSRTAPRDCIDRLRGKADRSPAEKKFLRAFIKDAYDPKPPRTPAEIADLKAHRQTRDRIADLEAVFADHYGDCLPDDDSGNEDLYLIANHIAHRSEIEEGRIALIVQWAADHAPDIARHKVMKVARKVAQHPLRWKAKTLGVRLNVTSEQKARLGLKTIRAADTTEEEDAEARKVRRAAAEKARRRRNSTGKPRGRPSKGQPWLAEGIGRTAYFKREKLKRDQAVDARTKMRGPYKKKNHGGHALKSADQEAPAIESAANPRQQRAAGAVPVHEDECRIEAATPNRQRAAGASQPSIDAAPSFMDGTGFECTEAREVRAQAATSAATGIRHQMIDLARAVRAMPRPAFLIGQRGDGAPARVGWALAASGGLGGWIASGSVPQRVVGRPWGENRRQA